ncbi:DnaD family protein [Spiroplasma culicicola]|uniref:Putative dnad-like replication protein n=1 Tax=Spiroplasma culicicola AES-1 TaxID=1276246 RepID=W6AG28_9MOLU|nr:DnaD family protein [Spiroplasma culicicola]AHI52664.1 putative dnad-like replication protein [Spiroplasma culicicola AES-1]
MFDLLKTGIINKRTLLILNYAKLDINENQLAIILIIMELSNEEQKNFTASHIAQYMSIDKEAVEQEISKLLVSHLIKLEQNGKKTVLDLMPLFARLTVILEEENSKLITDNNYEFIEQMLKVKMTTDMIEEIDSYMKKGLSKPKIMSLMIENDVKAYDQLIKHLKSYIKNNEIKITRYNWLND